jgi:hypothetical protein
LRGSECRSAIPQDTPHAERAILRGGKAPKRRIWRVAGWRANQTIPLQGRSVAYASIGVSDTQDGSATGARHLLPDTGEIADPA